MIVTNKQNCFPGRQIDSTSFYSKTKRSIQFDKKIWSNKSLGFQLFLSINRRQKQIEIIKQMEAPSHILDMPIKNSGTPQHFFDWYLHKMNRCWTRKSNYFLSTMSFLLVKALHFFFCAACFTTCFFDSSLHKLRRTSINTNECTDISNSLKTARIK